MEVIRHCLLTANAKVLILRKTERSQDNSTLDTFSKIFRNLGPDYAQEGELSLFKIYNLGSSFRLPSTDAIARFRKFLKGKPGKQDTINWLATDGDRYCSHVHFAGVPDATKRATRFRGMECSMLVFVEADEMQEADWRMAQPCVRWRDAYGKKIKSGGCIIDTNPPSPRHWIAQLEYAAIAEKSKTVQFWHIPTQENAHTVGQDYVDNLKFLYRNDRAGYDKMVLGQYADSYDGSPVYFAFNTEKHAFNKLDFPKGAYLVRGWDFGTTNTVTWSAYFRRIFPPPVAGGPPRVVEYWWDLHELFEEQSDTERQCRRVSEITAQRFPFWNNREICAGVMDYCDPAGNAKKSTGQDVDILRSHGFKPGFKFKQRGLQVTFAIVNRLFEAQDPAKNYCYRIDRSKCERLFSALQGGYRYPKEGEPGFGLDTPLKGPASGNFDHICDAQRYAIINAMRLADVGNEKLIPHTGALERGVEINRPKVIY